MYISESQLLSNCFCFPLQFFLSISFFFRNKKNTFYTILNSFLFLCFYTYIYYNKFRLRVYMFMSKFIYIIIIINLCVLFKCLLSPVSFFFVFVFRRVFVFKPYVAAVMTTMMMTNFYELMLVAIVVRQYLADGLNFVEHSMRRQYLPIGH